MVDRLTLDAAVSYADVDRQERMLLPRFFKLLQEAAILHANQFGIGANAVVTRAETWVLNRIAVEIVRYPAVGERLRVETWSTGIKSFKGYRDFRVFDAKGKVIGYGSSLWLYLRFNSKSIVRVPREVADTFPIGAEAAWHQDLDVMEPPLPSASAGVVTLTLRYSDFDVNEHVNNAAYLDFVQAALSSLGQPVRPRRIALQFKKAISTAVERVSLRLERAEATTRFSIEEKDAVFAVGELGGHGEEDNPS